MRRKMFNSKGMQNKNIHHTQNGIICSDILLTCVFSCDFNLFYFLKTQLNYNWENSWVDLVINPLI